jgi:hypothetical protein
MAFSSLPVDIIEVRAEGLPRRQLVFSCHVSNPGELDICILDAWVTVQGVQGLKIAEGRLFHAMHDRVHPAVIKAGDKGLGALVIDLPPIVLRSVEARRAGGDVELLFSSRVLVSNVSMVNEIRTLGTPFETTFAHEHIHYVRYLIPQSEWIKLLKGLSWSELEILELPGSTLRTDPILARALKRFEDAQEGYRRGAWEETLMNCRKFFEAMVQDATGSTDMKKTPQALKVMLGEGEKADRLNNAIREFNQFLHLGRHEQPSHITITRTDAQLALHVTGAFLAYLGSSEG